MANPTKKDATARTAGLVYSLPEQIAERIAEGIIDERYPPGSRLKEVELALAFGVSRAPVREALRILETQKLVRLTPQKGALVTHLSTEELAELFAIRAALMGLSIRKIAEKGTTPDIKALEARVEELESLAGRDDLRRYVRRLGDLSEFAAQAAGPGWIADLLLTTIRQTVKYSRRGLMSKAAATDINAGWRRVLKAIAAHDGDLAEKEAKDLILTAWNLAIPTLEPKKPGEVAL
jgi:DNA-binding GntR family transcriptional regulator